MKKNLLQVMIANIFYMVIVAGTNFILPRFTTVETYAAVKSYTLYISTYADIVTLGYLQGVYIRYGGKETNKISTKELGSNFLTFVAFMLPISIVISLIGVFTNDMPLTVFGAGLVASEAVMYFQFLYQATGEFKAYGVALNASKVLVFVTYLVLIFELPSEIEILFVAAAPVSCIFVTLYLGLQLNKKIDFLHNLKLSPQEFVCSIKDGFVIMLGNFVTSFFTTIDRWFVKTLMLTINFAFYSFAVSLENIVNTFMRPITVSMYNYFCKRPSQEEIIKIKDYSIIYSFIIIAAAYPAKWILEVFIQDYLPSASIIFPLFAAQGISTVIKGIYINKYKADGEQNKYLFQMIGVLILAVVLNATLYFKFRSMEAIAAATLIVNIVWFIYCELTSTNIRCKSLTYLSMGIMLATYLYTGQNASAIIGCIMYCSVGLITASVFMREALCYLLNSLLGMVLKKIHR